MINAKNLKNITYDNIECIKKDFLIQIEKEILEASAKGFFKTKVFLDNICTSNILNDIVAILKNENYSVNVSDCGKGYYNYYKIEISWN